MSQKKLQIFALVIVLLLLLGYSLFQLSKSRTYQLFGKLYNRVETNEKVVALTFDDAPAPKTEEILGILKEKNVKATFFLIGGGIEQNKEITKQIIQNGHEIGNHSYSHKRMVFKTPRFIKEEIEKTDKLIKELGYQGEIHFRPPNGKKLVLLPYYLKQNNKKTIMWDVEPETYPEIAADSQKIVEYTLKTTKPGSIILLHGMWENKNGAETREALPEIIEKLSKEGYKFVTVSEILKNE